MIVAYALEAQPPQVGVDGLLQFRGFGELGVQFSNEARHLFPEGLTVVLDFLGADVAAGREDVAVRGNFGGGGGFAEARHIGKLTRRRGDAEARRDSEPEVFSPRSPRLRVSPTSPRHAW